MTVLEQIKLSLQTVLHKLNRKAEAPDLDETNPDSLSYIKGADKIPRMENGKISRDVLPETLPEVTTEDNDKILKVIDGEWVLTEEAVEVQNQIDNIKDGKTIDSFSNVEKELEKKQEAGDYATKTEAQSYANAKVASITAGDTSINVGGSITSPTVAVKVSEDSDNSLQTTNNGLKVVIPKAAEYTIEKLENSGEYAAIYNLKKDGNIVGASINIPKDMVVSEGSVVTDPEGQPKGTYIKLVLQNIDEPLYINVSNLIEYVTSGSNANDMVVITISDDHKVTASITDGSITLAKLETGVQGALNKAHSHGNKELLDGYTQSNEDLSDAVNKKHKHNNAEELDKVVDGDVEKWNKMEENAKEYTNEQISSLNIGQYAKTTDVESVITQVNEDITKNANDITVLDGRVGDNETAIVNRYTKDETDTAISTAIANIDHLKREIVTVEELATKTDVNTIYMVKVESAMGDDKYQEYMIINGSMILVGDTSIDMTPYAKTSDVESAITQAKEEAISTAASDATLKANTAESNAKAAVNELASGTVASNKAAIDVLNGEENINGSIKKQVADALSEAKQYADDNDNNTEYGIEYDSTNKKIRLTNDTSKTEIDASVFIKDGMISNVEIIEIEEVQILKIIFNTDAGLEPIEIPLTSLVDIYTGQEGTTINVSVSSDNKISAEVNYGSIRKDHLNETVNDSLNKADNSVQTITIGSGTTSGTLKITVNDIITDNIEIEGLATEQYVDDRIGLFKKTSESNTSGEITVNANVLKEIPELTGETSIVLGEGMEGYDNEWDFTITQGETAQELTLPTIKWGLGINPVFGANTTTLCRLYYIGETLCGEWSVV